MDTSRIFKFLAGLNVEYDEVRGRIIGRNPLPPIGEVFAEVRREESRRQVMLGKKTAGSTASIEGSALAIPEAQVSSRTSHNQHAEDKKDLQCDYCGKPRHTREKCWKLHGKPPNGKGKKFGEHSTPTANEAESSPFSKEQLSHLLKLLKSCSSSNAPIGSMAQTGSNSLALFVLGSTTPWIIDSGASDHMTSCSQLFDSYYPCSGSEKIRIADGSFSPIAGKGNIKISEKISLKSVLHVPKLACNLLSVSKLSKDSDYSILFSPSNCVFQDRNLGKMIGTAREINGLYYYDGTGSENKTAHGLGSTSSSFVYDQVMLWHKRLGHPSFPYLKSLFPELFKGIDCSKLHCEACNLAKSHRVSFPIKPYSASKPFYLLHSDVWGPSKVNTLSGKKWFVTFIDDHTRDRKSVV